MPLRLELRDPNNAHRWIVVGTLMPGQPSGSVSNNTPEGRDIYLFACLEDGSKSVIHKSDMGVDIETAQVREIVNLTGFSVVKELREGETYEMDIRSDQSPETRHIRFTHTK